MLTIFLFVYHKKVGLSSSFPCGRMISLLECNFFYRSSIAMLNLVSIWNDITMDQIRLAKARGVDVNKEP